MTSGTQIVASLLAEIESYLARTNTSSSALSIAATGGWATIKRLRNGDNIMLSTGGRLRRVMFEYPSGVSGFKEAVAIRRKAIEEERRAERR